MQWNRNVSVVMNLAGVKRACARVRYQLATNPLVQANTANSLCGFVCSARCYFVSPCSDSLAQHTFWLCLQLFRLCNSQ